MKEDWMIAAQQTDDKISLSHVPMYSLKPGNKIIKYNYAHGC
jgi:hypothetical protein